MVVDVVLNDQLRVPFYVDTGASGISLPQTVADRLGIRVDSETRFVHVRTANGVASRPVVTLESVQLAGARVEWLEATVNPLMDVGLLGGSFFNNFVYRVDAAAGVIELEANEGIRGGAGADEWRDRFRRVRSPLARLEAHLDSTEITRPGRRAELEARRVELRRQLEELELAANQAGVPVSWRE
jgi:clan AA aspartic protease (TIGR02281 family)